MRLGFNPQEYANRVKLVIDPGKGDYSPSNKIKFYAKRAAPEPNPEPEKPVKLDDDIPF